MIEIKIYRVTALRTNCCYLRDSATGKSAVVDPGEKSQELIDKINEDGGKLEYVMLTHGHYDHIGYADELAKMFGAEIVTGEKNVEFLRNPDYNLSINHGKPLMPFLADVLLRDGESFQLGNTRIHYMSTPGHTSGCGSYIFDKTILCGDTLFCESYGRTDLPTGDEEMIKESLKKLKNLDGDYEIICGHGENTTLEHERKYNPLMRRL